MAPSYTFTANPRSRTGTGPARALRRAGRIPAIVFGDNKPVVSIDVPQKEAMLALRRGGFLTRIGAIMLEGTAHDVIVRDVQLDPVRDDVIHIDFMRVSGDTQLVVEVPVRFVNEETCPGLKRGGVINVVRRTVELNVPADAIPQYIDVDLIAAGLGDSIHISAVSLPEGCMPTITDRDFTIATIAAPAGLKDDAAGEADEDSEAEEQGQEADNQE